MKKTIPAFVIMISFTIPTWAQFLVDTNKVWNVAECMNFGPCGTNVYRFDGDTLIGIHQYRLLAVDNDSAAFISPYEPIAMREDSATKQVFFYDSNGESLIYDFSLSQGASYITTLCGCSIEINVDSVDSVILLSGEQRKRMLVTITTIGGSCIMTSYSEVWIEGIGSLMGLTRAGYFTIVADIFPELICFTENDTPKYQNMSYGACFFTTVAINEYTTTENLIISPNPTSTSFSIQLPPTFGTLEKLEIFNSVGQMVGRYKTVENIDVSGYPKGLYFVVVTGESSERMYGRVVKE